MCDSLWCVIIRTQTTCIQSSISGQHGVIDALMLDDGGIEQVLDEFLIGAPDMGELLSLEALAMGCVLTRCIAKPFDQLI